MDKEAIKNYFAPLARAFFGKQTNVRAPIEENEIYAVEVIVRDLLEIQPLEWAEYAFSREPLNGKFDSEKRLELFEKAYECGKQAAVHYKNEYDCTAPVQLAKKLKLVVEYPMMPQSIDRVLFAEYVEPKNIYIYMDGIYKAKKLLAKEEVASLFSKELDVSGVLLSHELFHVVEEKEKDTIWTANFKMDLRAGKRFKNSSRIAILSEIAAMGFAQELASISFSPYVLDAFLVYGYSPKAASALYEEMMLLAKKALPSQSLEEA